MYIYSMKPIYITSKEYKVFSSFCFLIDCRLLKNEYIIQGVFYGTDGFFNDR